MVTERKEDKMSGASNVANSSQSISIAKYIEKFDFPFCAEVSKYENPFIEANFYAY